MKKTTTLPRIRPRKSQKQQLAHAKALTRKRTLRREKRRRIIDLFLGFGLVAAIAIGGWFSHSALGVFPLPIYVMVLAIAGGSLIDRVPRLKALPLPYEVPLALGLILLGGQFSGQTLEMLGLGAPLRLLGHWVFSGLLFWLAIRLGLLAPRMGALSAVGVTGSGVSAQVAASDGDKNASLELRSAAMSLSLVLGAFGLVVFPIVKDLLGLSAREFATLAGLASPTTAEAVMVASADSPQTLAATGAWRFLMNAMQGLPVVLYLAMFAKSESPTKGLVKATKQSLGRVPTFVWGLAALGIFALAVGFREHERAAISSLASWCLLMALAGIGVRIRLSQIRGIGLRRFIVVVGLWILGIIGLCGVLLAERWLF